MAALGFLCKGFFYKTGQLFLENPGKAVTYRRRCLLETYTFNRASISAIDHELFSRMDVYTYFRREHCTFTEFCGKISALFDQHPFVP